MKAEFNEFSYGFAFLHGFVASHPGLQSAPLLPSLQQEGKIGGFDVALDYPGVPVFVQFKLSEALIRSNVAYWRQHGGPYYRFDVTNLKTSQQHNLLKRLCLTETHVYYAAPLFFQIPEFNGAYLTDDVANQSIWIPVAQLPDLQGYRPAPNYLRRQPRLCVAFDGLQRL